MKFAALAALAAALILSACAGAVDLAQSPHTFAACKAADAATTLHIVKAGGAELNPLLRACMSAFGATPGMIVCLAGLTAVVYAVHDSLTPTQALAVNAIGCAPVLWNATQ